MVALGPDLAVLAAGLGAVFAGQLHVLATLRRRCGGADGSIVYAYRRRWRQALTVMVADLLGGLVAGIAAAFSGITEPQNFVAFVVANPFVGWFAVGLVGPVVSSRALLGSISAGRLNAWLVPPVEDKGEPERLPTSNLDDPSLLAQMQGVRHEAVATLVRAGWLRVSIDLHREYQALLAQSLDLVLDQGHGEFLVRTTRSFVAEFGDTSPGAFVTDLLGTIETRTGLQPTTDHLEALVDALAAYQMWEPLEALVTVAGGE